MQFGFFRAKVVVVGQIGSIRTKVFVSLYKWLYSGKNWLYSSKLVVFGQKWLCSGKSSCIRVKLL